MKNWKVSIRLIVAFSSVIVLSLIVTFIGYLGMRSLNASGQKLYEKNVTAIVQIGHVSTNLQEQRVALRSILLYASGSEESVASITLLNELETAMDSYINAYLPTINTEEDREIFERFTTKYYGDFADTKASVRRLAGTSTVQSSATQVLRGSVLDIELDKDLDECYAYNITDAQQTVSESNALFGQYNIYQILTFIFAIGISVLIGMLLNYHIANPLRKMVRSVNQIAEGDLDVNLDIDSTDEVGVLAEAFRNMAANIKLQALSLQKISEGDLTADISASGAKDIVGNSLLTVSESLNRLIHEIQSASAQVAHGANQVSDGSQVLAQGTSEQATAIEELSSSIFEISLNTKENAKMAEKAAELYKGIKERAQESTSLMKDMMRAVEEINEASVSISKIIRLINDISFQTNILSLNAAVEAANAGQHGKGFAVVAGEVRNLAAKSSQAATDTDVLIENSIEKARLGASIAKRTQEALGDIVTDILHSAELINDIAKATNEQALGVEQVNVGIDQVAQVVNMNSSTAEQSAMAAETMAAQASAMEQLVSNFKLKPNPNAASPEVLGQLPAHPALERKKREKKPVIILQDNNEKY